jgi:hypothetical protein
VWQKASATLPKRGDAAYATSAIALAYRSLRFQAECNALGLETLSLRRDDSWRSRASHDLNGVRLDPVALTHIGSQRGGLLYPFFEIAMMIVLAPASYRILNLQRITNVKLPDIISDNILLGQRIGSTRVYVFPVS